MQLQEEIKTCKQERNMCNRENVFLRTQIKNLEKELNRKDGVIK
jgi:cell division protein FtsB